MTSCHRVKSCSSSSDDDSSSSSSDDNCRQRCYRPMSPPEGNCHKLCRRPSSSSDDKCRQRCRRPSSPPKDERCDRPIPAPKDDREDESPVCKICLNNPIDILIEGCNHVVTCASCTSQIKDCPMCRNPIVKTRKVFLA